MNWKLLGWIAGLALIAWLVQSQLSRQYHKGQADAIAAERRVQDELRAEYRDSLRTARLRADSLDAEAARIAADAQERIRQATTRVSASRDSVAILRARVDTLESVPQADVSALVEQYETVIEQQDTVIRQMGRQLAAERLRIQAQDTRLVALERENAGLLDAVNVRDREIAALRDALDSGSLLPDGLIGDVLGFAAGFGLGSLLSR